MTEPVRWTCPTCHVEVTRPFCARCGEEPLVARHLTLRGLAEKLLHALTSIDARTVRSVPRLVRCPGALTLDSTGGVRKPYVAPFQLFLIANVLFFAVQWATGEAVLSSPLESHLHHQDWSEWAQAPLARRLVATQTPLQEYAPVFDRAVVLNAKSLVVPMTMPFALLLALVFARPHRPFMVHMVFALHLYAFLLLLFCVALLAARVSAWLGFGGLAVPTVDNALSVANLGACALYLHLAIGPVYGSVGVRRLAQTVVLALAVALIVLAYRFAMFLVTLYAS